MRSYRIFDGEGDIGELEWVAPVKDPKLRLVAVSESDAEILAQVAHGLRAFDAHDAADVLIGLAAAYRIGIEAA